MNASTVLKTSSDDLQLLPLSVSTTYALTRKQGFLFSLLSALSASLNLLADYEKSYKIYEAAHPDPDLAKKEAEEKASKEALAKQLKEEELLHKQEVC